MIVWARSRKRPGLSFSALGNERFRFRIGASDILTIDANGVNVSGVQVHMADYVFEDDYELMPLAELGSFIAENKHLPEIPSAEDVRLNGMNLSNFQIQLLKKIEELTLYTLKQQAMLEELSARQDTSVSAPVD